MSQRSSNEGNTAEAAESSAPLPEAQTPGSVAPEDRAKLTLTRSEYNFALQIKSCVEAAVHLHNLTDFDYVCFAIANEGESMEQVLARIYTLQCFREHYNILDTAEEGMELIYQLLVVLQPFLVLDIEYVEHDQAFFSVCDLAKADPSQIKTHNDHRIFLGGYFYWWHCHYPEFRSLRNGKTVLCECMDTSMKNYDAPLSRKMLHEVLTCYPKVDKALCYIHSPAIPSMMYSMVKDYLPEKIREAFRLDHVIPGLEDQRLDAFYNVPTPEDAQARLLLKIAGYLNARYNNRNSFSFENVSIMPETMGPE